MNNCVFSQDNQDKGTMQVNQCHGSIIYFLLLKRNKNHPTTVKKTKKWQNFILFHTNWLPRLLYLIIIPPRPPYPAPMAVPQGTVTPFHSQKAGAHTDEIPCPRSLQLRCGWGGIWTQVRLHGHIRLTPLPTHEFPPQTRFQQIDPGQPQLPRASRWR